MTSPLSVSCTAIFNGLMISGLPGRYRIGTIGVTKLVKYYTAVALAVLLRVCMLFVLIITGCLKKQYNLSKLVQPANQHGYLLTAYIIVNRKQMVVCD